MADAVKRIRLGKKGKKKLAEGGLTDELKKKTDIASMGVEAVGDIAGAAFDASKKEITDDRINPAAMLQKNNSLGVAGDITKSTVSGVATGLAVGGPLGAAVGGALGLLKSGASAIFGVKKRKREVAEATEEWNEGWNQKYTAGLSTRAYADGGEKKRRVYMPGDNAKYDRDLVIDSKWAGSIKGAKDINELDNAVIGQWEDKPLTMSQFLAFPERVKNYYKPHMMYEFQKKKLGLPNTYDEINMKPSPGGTGDEMYTPAINAKAAGNDVAYIGKPASKEEPLIAGYKEGGKIKGAGTAKSDSISKDVSDGSFIVPAENSGKAMRLGRQYLGWSGDEVAARKYPGTEVKVSDGELLFTPEEVDVLSYNGIDLNSLAPNAKPGDKMAGGGRKDTERKYEIYKTNYLDKSPRASEETVKKGFEDFMQANEGYAKTKTAKEGSQGEGGMSLSDKILSFAPEITGAIQASAGARANQLAGEMPDINVSSALKGLSAELRKDAEYGLEPGAKSAMLNQAEKSRRDATNAIVTRGGSSAEVMSNLQGILGTTIDKKFDIEIADAAEKVRKKGAYVNSRMAEASQEMEIQKLSREDWLAMQEINSGLLSAGISNIVGARKLKAEMEAMKKIGSASPSFILNKP